MRNWEKNIRKVEPYVPGEQPKEKDIIKLNTNENPYPPAKGVQNVLNNFNADDLRLYPDPESERLIEALAERYDVLPSQIFVGVGSDDVLSMAFMTFFNSDKPVVFPNITYSFYDVWAEVYNIPYKTIPLDENLSINEKDYNCENGGVIFPNPNAPTGVYESLDKVEEIIKANRDVVVIIDEAYIDFGGESCIPLLKKYGNLLVVQTFSKSRSMAGARIGFAIGSEKLIKYLNDVKFSVNSYTMNCLTQKIGVEAVLDEDYFKKTVNRIISTRENAKIKLKELGFDFPDSKSNFIFASHKSIPAKVTFEELKKRKIFVRYWNKPGIDNYLRITIGTDEEMEKLYKAIEDILEKRRRNYENS